MGGWGGSEQRRWGDEENESDSRGRFACRVEVEEGTHRLRRGEEEEEEEEEGVNEGEFECVRQTWTATLSSSWS